MADNGSVDAALMALRFNLRFMQNVVRWERVPARPARVAPFPPMLDARIVAALRSQNLESVYTHQAAAVTAALAGDNVAIVTPAASGKTLCYNIPVLHRLLADPRGRALYLFPTKALAQDQLAGLNELVGKVPGAGLTTAVYDGDTPQAKRSKVRDAARIILSNPDMLHMGILPQHPRWSAFFAALRVVVLDEMHVYRGVFGSHVANVLRRLRRICRFYGSDPQFILASATIANPSELAERLVENPVTVVGPDQDGSPAGERNTLFYNPPIVDPELGIRKSHRVEAAELASYFIEHEAQTIVFARSRLGTELLLGEIRDRAIGSGGAVHGYRSGYLPSERRSIEQGLRSGTVRGVVATSALELGIDIGRLEVAILAGYPGTIAATRQQMGRAGRRTGSSVAILVAGMGPLDQYVISHPRWLLAASPEHARLNADNEFVLAAHLVCASAELPLRSEESLGRAPAIAPLLDDLVAAGQLYRTGDRCLWAGDGSPAAAVSLRSAGPDRVIIQVARQGGRPEVIGEVDRPGVPLLVYEGAVYLHEGDTYVVTSLDLAAGVATVEAAGVDYYTMPSSDTTIEMITAGHSSASERNEALAAAPASPGTRYLSGWGDARVTRQPTGYKIIRRGTNEVLGLGAIDLEPTILETQACWLSFPEDTIEALKAEGAWLSDPNEYGPNWPAQRRAARSRDGFRCQGCGMPESPGKQHDVHHKVPFRAFVGDATRREGLPASETWRVANRLANLVTLCPACHRSAEAAVRTRSGLGGAAALIGAVAPLFLMCDPGDLGIVAEPQDSLTGRPTITVYERIRGGIGYAEQLYLSLGDILGAALDLVAGCPCEHGCPACVGPVPEHEYALDTKYLAAALLRYLTETALQSPPQMI